VGIAVSPQALLVTATGPAPRKSVAALSALRSPLAFPMLFRLARAAANTGKGSPSGRAVTSICSRRQLEAPGARAWCSWSSVDSARRPGRSWTTRTPVRAVAKSGSASPAARQAAVRRLASTFEAGE